MRERLKRNVRALRAELGLTAKEAAARGGLSQRHWQKIEAGEANVTLGVQARLCNALGVETADLLRPV